MKRFSYNQYIRKKIDDDIDFPIVDLSLDSPIISEVQGHDSNIFYDLYGISNHIGNLGSGHYIANCKSFTDNKWYLKNDEYVSLSTPESGKNSTAYVLFYKRKH